MVNVKFLNHEGGGFPQSIDVQDGTTILNFLTAQLGEQGRQRANDFIIRVNRGPVEEGYILQANDVVQITPTKVHGA